MRKIYLDFEFTGVQEKDLDVVSVAYRVESCPDDPEAVTKTRWLYRDDAAKRKFIADIEHEFIKHQSTLVAYVAEAEVRALLSLSPTPRQMGIVRSFNKVDLYLEYRNILNRNDNLSYGEQYIDGEVIVTTPPPNKWELVEDDDTSAHHKPEYSLAAATFKLLQEKIDTEEKDYVRGVIIRGDQKEIESHREQILRYNASDILYLPRLLKKVSDIYTLYGQRKKWVRYALGRGSYATETAFMIRRGYPVNVPELKKFAAASKEIMAEAAKVVNDSGVWAFRADGSMDQKAVQEWVKKFVKGKNIKTWRRTPKGELSISKDAFGDYKDGENGVDNTPFGAAFRKYLSTKQSLNGFLPPREGAKRKKTFWDFLGSDGRVRPHFGIFGSQTSRSQPAATGFMFLKAKWMRYFVEPPPGSFLIEVDYSSQEFLIAAIISQDKKMMNAYASGDVYLAFAKDAGLVPRDGTRKKYEDQRKLCKGIVLGVSYDMSAKGLAPRIGKTEEEAQGLINKFYEAYPDYAAWKKETIREYQRNNRLELLDGWILGPHNDNMRSVGNFPIQGHGAVIMRQAVKNLSDYEIPVVFTVHDSIVCEVSNGDPVEWAEMIKVIMGESFKAVMSTFGETRQVRMDAKVWGGGKRYIAEGSEKQLKQYKKYFS